MSNEIMKQSGSIFDLANFESAQRVAKALASSDLVPKSFQGSVANVLIAMDISHRTGFSPFAVMQNLHVIHGRPSWSASFIAGAIGASGRFGPLKIVLNGEGENRGCHVEAKCLKTGETVTGARVNMAMAKAEGWLSKQGSKWLTMPDLMLQYRAISFFGRVHASDILMGLQTDEEVIDSRPADLVIEKSADPIREKIADAISLIPAAPAPAPAQSPAPAESLAEIAGLAVLDDRSTITTESEIEAIWPEIQSAIALEFRPGKHGKSLDAAFQHVKNALAKEFINRKATNDDIIGFAIALLKAGWK